MYSTHTHRSETRAQLATRFARNTRVLRSEVPLTEDQMRTATPSAFSSKEAPVAGIDIKPIKVALILPSTINDMAWSQSIYVSLKEIQDQVGKDVLDLAYTENMFKVPDAAAAIPPVRGSAIPKAGGRKVAGAAA